jgi:6-pyruvoyltetrahydropterin/6-carboxytetrahydropterin synthase
MLSVTKIFSFEAAHYLPKHKGKCAEFHGHSYKLEVEIAYENTDSDALLNDNFMVVDFSDIKKIVDKMIEEGYDHKFLNELIEHPTAENMVLIISDYLKTQFKNPLQVIRVRLWETANSYAEWRK